MYALHGLCPVKYDKKCFFTIFDYDWRINLDIGGVLCQEKGAKAGNLYSNEHMLALGDYMRPFLVITKGGRNYISVFTAMEFNPSTGFLTLSDNSQSDVDLWFPGNPAYDPERTRIGFRVGRTDDSNGEVTIFDTFYQGAYLDGVLCEIDLA